MNISFMQSHQDLRNRILIAVALMVVSLYFKPLKIRNSTVLIMLNHTIIMCLITIVLEHKHLMLEPLSKEGDLYG